MAAGVLSIDASVRGLWLLSDVLLVLGLLAIAATAVWDIRAIFGQPARANGNLALVLFSWVAACGVLGQRLNDVTLSALAAAGFLGALIVLTLMPNNPMPSPRWDVRGSWLLAVVALQSLSIAASSLDSRPFEIGAFGLWAAGIATYGVLIVPITSRLITRHVDPDGLAPDDWIAMGALAISTVAATEIQPLAKFAPAIWVVAAAWIPYLSVLELLGIRRRGLEFIHDQLRWSTVFPLGMFSLATHDLGIPTLELVAIAFLWIGVAVASLNLVAALSSAKRQLDC